MISHMEYSAALCPAPRQRTPALSRRFSSRGWMKNRLRFSDDFRRLLTTSLYAWYTEEKKCRNEDPGH